MPLTTASSRPGALCWCPTPRARCWPMCLPRPLLERDPAPRPEQVEQAREKGLPFPVFAAGHCGWRAGDADIELAERMVSTGTAPFKTCCSWPPPRVRLGADQRQGPEGFEPAGAVSAGARRAGAVLCEHWHRGVAQGRASAAHGQQLREHAGRTPGHTARPGSMTIELTALKKIPHGHLQL